MTATRLMILAAGLMGAAGVAMLAVAAHAPGGPVLQSAALMLGLHATAVIAVACARKALDIHDMASRLAAWGLIAGPSLFALDIAGRTLASQGVFPMAAPFGGGATILAWLSLGLSAIVGRRAA